MIFYNKIKIITKSKMYCIFISLLTYAGCQHTGKERLSEPSDLGQTKFK